MDFINWDLNRMKNMVRNEEDDITRYNNFYKHFKG